MSWHKTEVLEEHFKATHEALASSAYLGPCAQANSTKKTPNIHRVRNQEGKDLPSRFPTLP